MARDEGHKPDFSKHELFTQALNTNSKNICQC